MELDKNDLERARMLLEWALEEIDPDWHDDLKDVYDELQAGDFELARDCWRSFLRDTAFRQDIFTLPLKSARAHLNKMFAENFVYLVVHDSEHGYGSGCGYMGGIYGVFDTELEAQAYAERLKNATPDDQIASNLPMIKPLELDVYITKMPLNVPDYFPL